MRVGAGSMWARVAVLALLTVLSVGPARAQQVGLPPEDLADRARIRFGPFYLQPWLGLTNAGLDTNVFDDYEEPKEDYTFTLTPGLDGGMRGGPARLNLRLATDYVWYRTYKSERGIDTSMRAQFELRYASLRPYVLGDFTHTRSRVGYEIDARAERSLPVYEAGVDARLASRTWITVTYRQAATRFLEGETFEGVQLDRALNSISKTASAGVRLELTPFTTLSILTQAQRVRFDYSTFRNNTSYAIMPTFDFSPDALITGRAMVGYRAMRAAAASVPDYQGPIANASLRLAPLSSTSFGVTVERDVMYSFEDIYPYYLQTAASASVTQRIVGGLSVSVQGRRAFLDYRIVGGDATGIRADTVTSVGGGAGYAFGTLARVGLDIEQIERRSDHPERGYRGTRIYGSVRYGF